MALRPSLIEGTSGGLLHYHLDLDNDVLYLRLLSKLDDETYGEETDDGFTLLRSMSDDSVAGLVVVSYWERFGAGVLRSTTLEQLERSVETMTEELPLAA